jgi:hypothetical protein
MKKIEKTALIVLATAGFVLFIFLLLQVNSEMNGKAKKVQENAEKIRQKLDSDLTKTRSDDIFYYNENEK